MKCFIKIFISVVLVLSLIPMTVHGAQLIYGLDYEFSAATPPAGGSTPWVTAMFDDSFGGANTVRLTMSTVNLVNSEFVSDWLFNFDDSFVVTDLSFTAVDNTDSTPNGIYTGKDAYKADGDGYFDIEFGFPTSGNKFTTCETVIYDITYTAAINVSAFDFGSASGGGAGTYETAAHVQGIGVDGSASGWIGGSGEPSPAPIPEPSTLLLLGMGLLGLAGLGIRRRK